MKMIYILMLVSSVYKQNASKKILHTLAEYAVLISSFYIKYVLQLDLLYHIYKEINIPGISEGLAILLNLF